jgi:hypothetical protein
VTQSGGGHQGEPPPGGWSAPGAYPPANWSPDPAGYPSWQPTWPPTAPSYAWGPAGPEPANTTNPWAIVSLVSGILAVVPVAVVAGVVAVWQINRKRQEGLGMALAGIVTGAAWTVLGLMVAVGILLFRNVDPGFDGSLGRVADAGSTSVGDCLSEPGQQDSISRVVDCEQDHGGEVYLVDELGAAAWPGYDQVWEDADTRCYDAFEPFVGETYEWSGYDYGFFLPDQAEWLDGEVRVVCVVLPGPGDIRTGSARNSGR